jgi:hypothetical protein
MFRRHGGGAAYHRACAQLGIPTTKNSRGKAILAAK